MLAKYWYVKPAASRDVLRQYPMHPALAQVLYSRGFDTPQKADQFLSAENTIDGNLLSTKGRNRPIDRFIGRVLQAIDKQEKIVIYGDFDADGVTSTALMMQVLTAMGANARYYIPHRANEGYGLNSEALLKLRRQGAGLVITVDCGIRSVEEVEAANAEGLDIIITDHHSLGQDLPNAFAVINPKHIEGNYSEDMLAGVGVAYRVIEALLTVARNRREFRQFEFPLEDLLDLVAIGTVADLAPMDRPQNRALVRRGIEVLNRAKRPGVRALMEVAGLEPGSISSTTIGFSIGPRINAAGRLDSATVAYELLSTTDARVAEQHALTLQTLNLKRQDLTRSAQEMVREQVEAAENLPLIFAADESFQPGIVGLVAGRLTEAYYRPSIVMETGATESRASCRSIPEFDITDALDQCADLLVRHGGHAQAAGFTVLNENIPALQARLLELAETSLSGHDLQPMLEIEAEIAPEELSMKLVSEMARLEPTGHHNQSPVLMSSGLQVLDFRKVGKTGDHLKLQLQRNGSAPLDAIAFGLGSWADAMPPCVDVAYYLEINEYNGRRSLQLNVQDIRRAE
jgi:single-stranded-DNA-specific exonuclease